MDMKSLKHAAVSLIGISAILGSVSASATPPIALSGPATSAYTNLTATLVPYCSISDVAATTVLSPNSDADYHYEGVINGNVTCTNTISSSIQIGVSTSHSNSGNAFMSDGTNSLGYVLHEGNVSGTLLSGTGATTMMQKTVGVGATTQFTVFAEIDDTDRLAKPAGTYTDIVTFQLYSAQ